MPINVAHEPDPRLIAQAGYMTGIGKAYLRERDYYDKQNQEAYARYVDDYNRRKELEQTQYDRSKDSFNVAWDTEERGYKRAFDERDYLTDYEQNQFENRLSLDSNEAQWAGIDAQYDTQAGYDRRHREESELRRQEMDAKYNAEYQFTDEQKQQQHRLQQQIQSVQTDPTLNEQERAYALQQLQSQFDAIQPQLVPKQGPTAQEQFEQSVVEDPVTKMRFIAGADGKGGYKYEPIKQEADSPLAAEQKKMEIAQKAAQARTEADFGAAWTQAQKEVDEAEIDADPKNTLYPWQSPTPEQERQAKANWIRERTKQIVAEKQAARGEIAPPQQAPQPDPQAQPGVAQVDQGAQQNAQARAVPPEVEQLFMQYQSAKQSGNMELANQLKQQLLAAREAQMQPM